MNNPEVTCYVVHAKKLPPRERPVNSVILTVDTRSVVLLENPTTGVRESAPGSTPGSSYLLNFNPRSLSDIQFHLHNNLNTSDCWICVDLASKIATEATKLGCEHNNGFSMTMKVKITYKTVVVDVVKMVLAGKIDREELKNLKMETEPCSICFENLSGSKVDATRMTCSHVFHCHCLSKWLERRNTCPLCRTVLYDLEEG